MIEQQKNISLDNKSWFDRNYKLLLLIPVIIFLISIIYLGNFYSKNGDFLLKDVSLSGGTTITIHAAGLDLEQLEDKLSSPRVILGMNISSENLNFRKLSDFGSGQSLALVIESSANSEDLKNYIETVGNITLTSDNSSLEFTGPTLSSNFFKQLLFSLVLSFILMSIVIFIMFRTFIPSIAVIFAAFADIVMPLALIDFLGIRLSAAGIAAFLMLIGYSVDTDILLTTRAIRIKEGVLNNRIFKAFKTGILMTLTALFAVLPAFFIVTGLPDSFRQIFLVLALGLIADIMNTWLTNVGIIKWYCEKHNIK